MTSDELQEKEAVKAELREVWEQINQEVEDHLEPCKSVLKRLGLNASRSWLDGSIRGITNALLELDYAIGEMEIEGRVGL